MLSLPEKEWKEVRANAAAVLLCNGVTPEMDGFHYILAAVQIWREYDGGLPPAITKEVYPAIAKHYGRSWSAVERAIRCAIEKATATEERMQRCIACFGCGPDDGGTYNNAQFIALLTMYADSFLDAA